MWRIKTTWTTELAWTHLYDKRGLINNIANKEEDEKTEKTVDMVKSMAAAST
jgi:hypothetical protein